MKTLILSDTHLRHNIAEEIISEVEHDEIVFLGDEFDDFNDLPIQNEEAAIWLKDSLSKPNRIHLWGNHTMSYRYDCHRCSGFSKDKWHVINRVLKDEDWAKIRPFYVVDDWLFTHAGFHYNVFKNFCRKFHIKARFLTIDIACVVEALDAAVEDYELFPGPFHPLYGAGAFRGGRLPYGGITWCDSREFSPIPNVNQVFGHTENLEPIVIYSKLSMRHSVRRERLGGKPKGYCSLNYCIDNRQTTYAVLENNILNVFNRRGEKLT